MCMVHYMLQVRFPSGKVLRHNFSPTATLGEVATFVLSSDPKLNSVQLVQVRPVLRVTHTLIKVYDMHVHVHTYPLQVSLVSRLRPSFCRLQYESWGGASEQGYFRYHRTCITQADFCLKAAFEKDFLC